MKNPELKPVIARIENMSQKDSFISMQRYVQHGNTDCLLHSISVAYYSFEAAQRLNLKVNSESLIIGALLHDFFLYDWHKPCDSHKLHGFTHPKTACHNARAEWELNEIATDIILTHMFPLVPTVPRYQESVLVCIVDKICSLAEILHISPGETARELYEHALLKNKQKE